MTINNILKLYACKSFTPLQINFLNDYSKLKTASKIVHQTKFLHEEISIRLSHRVFDLLKLPYGLPLLKPIKNVIDLYCESFNRIQREKINCENDAKHFCHLLKDIKYKHNNLEENISKALENINKMLS